jgi:hypothetical protein
LALPGEEFLVFPAPASPGVHEAGAFPFPLGELEGEGDKAAGDKADEGQADGDLADEDRDVAAVGNT